MCVALFLKSISAILLINDNEFHWRSVKTNELIFRKFYPRCEKTVKRHYLAGVVAKIVIEGLRCL